MYCWNNMISLCRQNMKFLLLFLSSGPALMAENKLKILIEFFEIFLKLKRCCSFESRITNECSAHLLVKIYSTQWMTSCVYLIATGSLNHIVVTSLGNLSTWMINKLFVSIYLKLFLEPSMYHTFLHITKHFTGKSCELKQPKYC